MPGKKPAKTFEQMVETGVEQRQKSKLYKIENTEFLNEQLSNLVGRTTAELAEAATAEPVSLRDIASVKQRTLAYLKSCEMSATIPSIMGLSRSLGMSRQAIYDCMNRHSPVGAAEWLTLCKDAFSDILSEAALKNQVNTIAAIFVQKSIYGLRESMEIIAKSEANPLGEEVDLIELQKRIEANVVDYEDE